MCMFVRLLLSHHHFYRFPCSIRTVADATSIPSSSNLATMAQSTSPLPSSSSTFPHKSLGIAISAAAHDIVELCDAHQSISAARGLSEAGEATTGVEGMDRLAASATSLREAVEVLRRFGEGKGGGRDGSGMEREEGVTAAAAKQALGAVRDLAELLASEVCSISPTCSKVDTQPITVHPPPSVLCLFLLWNCAPQKRQRLP